MCADGHIVNINENSHNLTAFACPAPTFYERKMSPKHGLLGLLVALLVPSSSSELNAKNRKLRGK